MSRGQYLLFFVQLEAGSASTFCSNVDEITDSAHGEYRQFCACVEELGLLPRALKDMMLRATTRASMTAV